ncbi:cbb3-type cytochrome oxidase assembly protein CcoS [Sansalvadorimonas sp. 2012CJ34-2]|uniref:Cbb3-type cytochrome oxidase assembly protein CcoS n=1 Tax=Parendozoicomonas callyspongiae TaxID=2942213 RepID=A0ABT0PHY3_9GAMM|nr:cbb3-type cytochrome oxidase assembly protein CcoS [Sansalvadorimonas sp. 2012CJ34-2]MCL6271009.1 cbb3-type cytochrome oxidase assembly protein CcoS [Sansalvadorimonas sp. 2012CJ34-2]
MSSLYILIPLAVLFIVIAVGIFFWAVDNGQFDDLEGPAHSILFEEPSKKNKDDNTKQEHNSENTRHKE